MAADNFFEVPSEISVQRYLGPALRENLERFGQKPRLDRIAGQQLGHDIGAGFDMNLVAIGGAGQETIEVVCGFGARDVNNCHATRIPWASRLL